MDWSRELDDVLIAMGEEGIRQIAKITERDTIGTSQERTTKIQFLYISPVRTFRQFLKLHYTNNKHFISYLSRNRMNGAKNPCTNL